MRDVLTGLRTVLFSNVSRLIPSRRVVSVVVEVLRVCCVHLDAAVDVSAVGDAAFAAEVGRL